MSGSILNYEITEKLYESERTLVLRGRRIAGDEAVILKMLKPETATEEALACLRREFGLISRIDLPGVVKVYGLEEYRGSRIMVMEDMGGVSLDHLAGEYPRSPTQFLQLAIGLAETVAGIHELGIIHKDINPANIVVDPACGRFTLIDFGIAEEIPRRTVAVQPSATLNGTLAYISPEQTGRMNRAVDYRTDFYSLGATLYRLLTGRDPFHAEDALGFVHCHIAQIPATPHGLDPAIPETVSRIVMKLMMKMAEERYQSGRGLVADLERCLRGLAEEGWVGDFDLGLADFSDRLQIPQKLYGRERDVASLLEAFDRVVAGGKPEVVLLSGYAGAGKSTLVNELYKTLVPAHPLWAAGKCDRYKRDIPYATLGQALKTLVHHVLGKNEEELALWRAALREAVGHNGRLVADLVPDLEVLIGEQPPVPEASPQDAQHRFNTVFLRFLGAFARPEHPLVLFLDDLQWLDTATLQLLSHLLGHPEVKYLLLLGAYRDNEVGPAHPLMLALDALGKSGTSTLSMMLEPLTQDDVRRFVTDAFHCDRERAEPLARLVNEKTGGNPFFMIQFVSMLADEGLARFDRRTASWGWNLERIRGKGFTDNVVHLMAEKVSRLPVATRDALKQLATLGNKARIATLALVLGATTEQTEHDLREAVLSGLVYRQDDTFVFLHDRVQEAACSLIPEDEVAAVHLHIGRMLLLRKEPEMLAEDVFAVVNHLNRGIGLITEPAEKERLAELNVAAGKRARASIAYTPARNYFAAAAALLPDGAWDSRYAATFDLFMSWAECEYLQGAFAEAEYLFNTLLDHAKGDLDMAAVYELRLKVYQVAGRFEDAVAMGLKALWLFGVAIPADDDAISRETQAEAAAVTANLKGRTVAELAEAPEASDPGVRAVIGLLSNVAPSAYIGSTPQLFPLLILKLVNYSLRYGPTNESCHGYCSYGCLLGAMFGDPRAGQAFSEMSIRLYERFGDLRLGGVVHYLHGNHVNFWLNPIATDLPILEKGFLVCLDAGDLVFGNYIAYSIVWQAIERGDPLSVVLEFSGKYADFAKGSGNEAVYLTICLEQQFLEGLASNPRERTSFSDERSDLVSWTETIAASGFTCGIAYYHTMKLMAAHLLRDDAVAMVHGENAKKSLPAIMGMPMEATFVFFHALALARACREAAGDRKNLLKTLAVHERKLAAWADNCPANFACKHALVAAEIAEIAGDEQSAQRLLEQAVESARNNGFIHWQAMANEIAAGFHGRRGIEIIARAYLREARRCYALWGAERKVQQLEARNSWLLEGNVTERGTIGHSGLQVDAMAIAKAQQAISGEIVQEKLDETLLKIVLEDAGAQKGYLVENRNGQLVVVAKGEIGRDRIDTMLEMPVARSHELPLSVVNFVARTRTPVVLDDASRDSAYASDSYIAEHGIKSLLCLPIVHKSALCGLLYLENNLTTEAFTPDRLDLLKALSSQAAVSMENARLYACQENSIKELKLAKESILASNERFRSVLRAATAYSIIGTDPDGIVTVFNEGAELMLGFRAEEIIGKTTPVIFHDSGEFAARAAELGMEPQFEVFVAAARKGETETREWTYIRKNGSRIHVSLTVTSMRDEAGELTGFIGVGQDITERKRNEEMLHRQAAELEQEVAERQRTQEELQQLNEELDQRVRTRTAELSEKNDELQKAYEELKLTQARLLQQDKMASIGQLAAGVAHEINNPMGFISSNLTSLGRYLEKLTAYLDAGERLVAAAPELAASLAEQRKTLKIDRILQDLPELIGESRDGADRVRRIVQDLKSFSRLDSAEFVSADVNDGLESTLAIVWNELKYKTTVTRDYGELPKINCNLGQLNQVFMNLLVNAAQAIDRRGEIGIRTLCTNDGICVSISDNGCGMSEETRKKIFDPFFTTKDVGKGTGLGLAIAYDIIVNKHRGTIVVESEVGKGTTFLITLPLNDHEGC